jgi:hypothetical protein
MSFMNTNFGVFGDDNHGVIKSFELFLPCLEYIRSRIFKFPFGKPYACRIVFSLFLYSCSVMHGHGYFSYRS